eukprot:06874.XXX_432695_432814_1 [CDS] Oithona nana genome sequencing.
MCNKTGMECRQKSNKIGREKWTRAEQKPTLFVVSYRQYP